MYVAVIPNRGSPPAILLRESYREGGKTKNRTLANLSGGPTERLAQLPAVLRGDKLLPAAEAVEIVRALPHGHVLAALGTARRIALDAVLPRRAPQHRRDLALAMIVARLLEPAAKLATARCWTPSPPTIRWARCWGSARSPPRRSMARSTGWGADSRSSKPSWAAAICRMARCCSTMSPPPISKDAAANWRSMATAATTGVT